MHKLNRESSHRNGLYLIKGFCTAGEDPAFFEIASISSWFPTWIDAHGPLECRPTVAITRSTPRNLRRLNEVDRLRCHGIAMVQAAQPTE